MGERAVASRLSTLPPGWTVLHSLPIGRTGADIDHLVVGPGGVFSINTKHHVDASVWVAGRTVLVNGSSRQIVQKAEAEAGRVDRIVAGVIADPPAVRPIIAVVGAKRMRVRHSPRHVTVLRAEQLRRFLRNQPERLRPTEVSALVARFEDRGRVWACYEAGPTGYELARLLGAKQTIRVMEAHNGLSARIVKEAGFKAIWGSGLAISAQFGA